MPLSIRERVLAAVLARLVDRLAPAGDGDPAVPLRRNPGAPQEARTAVDLFDGGHERVPNDTTQDLYTLRVELDLYAPDGTALNALYGRVRAAVDHDRGFGGLAQDATEIEFSDPQPGVVPGHPDVVAAVLRIAVEFTTLDGDVAAQLS